ncbi:hypothetical protein L0Y65_04485 [Candidatus Micrarchaeota archaeon]|nr:hypothetical protein [Candidatus Micrarchaeota archaeon]
MALCTRLQPKKVQKLPDIKVFIKFIEGVPFEEALARAQVENHIIASNMRLYIPLASHGEWGTAYSGNEAWKNIQDAFPCWSGTMAAYTEPGKRFKKAAEKTSTLGSGYSIIYTDPQTNIRWLFPVPDEHLDRKNALLVSEHPNYKVLVDGNDRIVLAARVGLIKNFAAKEGWYPTDPRYLIPIGRAISPTVEASYNARISARVGPIARGYNVCVGNNRQIVNLAQPPSMAFGVVVLQKSTPQFVEGTGSYRKPPHEVGGETSETRNPEPDIERPDDGKKTQEEGFLQRLAKAMTF